MKRTPWPAELGPDTPTDRARTIARACWHALFGPDPVDSAEAIRDMAARFGEDSWLTPRLDTHNTHERMTRAEVADLAGVDPDTVTTWTARGFAGLRLTRHPTGYDTAEVRDFLRHRDTTRSRHTSPERAKR